MNGFIASRPLFMTGVFALLTLPFLLLINHYSPPEAKIPSGYSSSIVAFEFASDRNEVAEVLSPLSELELRNLDRINYVDFGFMLAYGAFLYLFMVRLGRLMQNDLVLKARWMVPLIVLADIIENIQLLNLREEFSTKVFEMSSVISVLIVATWTKWLLLAISFSIIGFHLSKMQNFSKLVGYLLFIPLVLGVIGFFLDNRFVENAFTTGVFSSFLLVFIYCLAFKRAI